MALTELKTVTDMRNILAEEIQRLRKGESSAANVNAIVNATGKILSSVKLELEYNRLLGTLPDIPFIRPGKKAITNGVESLQGKKKEKPKE